MAFPENIKTNADILNAFKVVLPYINHIVREDIVIGLSSTEEYVDYARGKQLDIDLAAGKPVRDIPTIVECIRGNKDTFADIGPEVYGKPIKTIFTPIHEASLIFIGVSAVVILVLYIRYRRNKKNRENVNMD